ncbi:MAG: hypothetical protein AB7U83_19880 [Vicinamibacterales bacterium]
MRLHGFTLDPAPAIAAMTLVAALALGVPRTVQAQTGTAVDFFAHTSGSILLVFPNCEPHVATSAGGLTLYGATSPGGSFLGLLHGKPVVDGEGQAACPTFIVPGIPPGTYWITVVYGLVTAVSVPPSAWKPITVGAACATAPLPPVLLPDQPVVTGNTVSIGFGGQPGCPPATMEIEVGSQPGLRNVGTYPLTTAGLVAAVPNGTYFVRARGRNAFGLSKPSIEVPITVPNTCTTNGPQGPIAPTATVSPGQVTLSWGQTVPGTLFYVLRIVDPTTGGAIDHLVIPPTLSVSAAVPPGTYRVGIGGGDGCGVRFPVTGDLTFTVP